LRKVERNRCPRSCKGKPPEKKQGLSRAQRAGGRPKERGGKTQKVAAGFYQGQGGGEVKNHHLRGMARPFLERKGGKGGSWGGRGEEEGPKRRDEAIS